MSQTLPRKVGFSTVVEVQIRTMNAEFLQSFCKIKQVVSSREAENTFWRESFDVFKGSGFHFGDLSVLFRSGNKLMRGTFGTSCIDCVS